MEIDYELLVKICNRYGVKVKKVEDENESGFIDYDGILKKSITEDITLKNT